MLIWYAAYGSNLLEERFLVYLRGGPVPGSGRMQHGARDRSDPVGRMPYRMEQPLGFGLESAGWGGGGVCFVDPDQRVETEPGVGATLGRAWLLTDEQLADVWAQENGTTAGPAVDGRELMREGSLDFGRGWYRKMLYLGELEGHPVATFTCEAMPPPNHAGLPYLDVVGRGLIETWDISPAEAADYLATRRGNDGHIDRVDLAERLSRR